MTPLYLRFQTNELSMWIIHRNAVSDEQKYSIQKIENRFRLGGIGESSLLKMYPYPIRWG
jgi:hypothetical protein